MMAVIRCENNKGIIIAVNKSDLIPQKLKNEGGREIARIGKEGDIYQSVVNAFNFT